MNCHCHPAPQPRHPASHSRNPAHSPRHPASLARHHVSLARHPVSLAPHPASLAPHPVSLARHPVSLAPHPASLAPHPVSLARHPVLDTGSRGTTSAQHSKHPVDSAVKPRNDAKQWQKKAQQKAFTLIEVLIALVILSIALLAIVKVMGDSIRGLEAVKERTIAHWIANDTISNAQLGLIPSPTPDNPEQSSTTMLHNTWYLNISAKETANKYSQQVKVAVSSKQDAKPLWTEYGFIGVSS